MRPGFPRSRDRVQNNTAHARDNGVHIFLVFSGFRQQLDIGKSQRVLYQDIRQPAESVLYIVVLFLHWTLPFGYFLSIRLLILFRVVL